MCEVVVCVWTEKWTRLGVNCKNRRIIRRRGESNFSEKYILSLVRDAPLIGMFRIAAASWYLTFTKQQIKSFHINLLFLNFSRHKCVCCYFLGHNVLCAHFFLQNILRLLWGICSIPSLNMRHPDFFALQLKGSSFLLSGAVERAACTYVCACMFVVIEKDFLNWTSLQKCTFFHRNVNKNRRITRRLLCQENAFQSVLLLCTVCFCY